MSDRRGTSSLHTGEGRLGEPGEASGQHEPSREPADWDSEAVQEVMGVLAREIGSPLTAIEVAVDRLRRRQRSPTASSAGGTEAPMANGIGDQDELGLILQQSHRLAGLARTLLAIAHPSTPRQRTLDLERLVSGVVETLRPELEAANIELRCPVAGCGLTAWGDPHEVRQALLALLGNARLALDDWPSERRIDVTCGAWSEEEVYVRIQDSGPGIPREREAKIFLPFISGWGREGVGLALTRLSLLRQGGDLLLEEQQDEPMGATFTVLLPTDIRSIGDHEESGS